MPDPPSKYSNYTSHTIVKGNGTDNEKSQLGCWNCSISVSFLWKVQNQLNLHKYLNLFVYSCPEMKILIKSEIVRSMPIFMFPLQLL